MNRFVIFGAGEFLADCYEPRQGDYLLAADGGYAHLKAMGLEPDGILGDFDSLGYVPPDARVFPTEKDDTDSMLAVRLGLEMGCRDFLLLGCLDGKRLDHTLANLQTLLFLASHGARGYLVGETYLVTAAFREELVFPETCRGILSLFCMGEPASGVCIRGLKYPLEGGTLTADFPLGVSNRFLGQESRISVREGVLLVMWDRENGMPRRCFEEETA